MGIFNEIDNILSKLKHTYREDAERVSEYDIVDHSTMILESERLERILRRQRKVYKFLGLSKEEFEQAVERGTAKKRKIRHIVTSYDTLFSVAETYKIDPGELLQTNNINSTEFVAGTEIIIEVEQQEQQPNLAGLADLPVIGEHKGIELLGRDLNLTVLPDSRGDLSVMTPGETIKQGVWIRLNTLKGDYPMNPGFGLNNYLNLELPADLKLAMIDKEAEINLVVDKRIKSIDSLQVTESVEAKTAGNIELNAEVTTIT